ncbi:MAG: TIGR00266 family protein [Clostridia bacterium]|nr:TIGR00266 family protein [Clostridia bacterium]MBP5270101.1 TIGR00266 family protein [Clostridia bacterium]
MKYEIKGEPMPVVVCSLDAGEKMITERGSMSWMSSNMKMETNTGGIGKAFGRMFAGEAMFRNVYTATGGPGMIAFGSSFVGSIRAIEITPGKSIICQKSAFLASTEGVELSVFFQKKIGGALFGGEGFIMQKISGTGLVFVEIDGSAVEYELAAGERLVLDTGHLAIADDTVSISVETVKGFKNVFFGGEGLFNTVVTGPGKVTLQTMPLSSFIAATAGMVNKGN